jgi:hypothetical protein
MLENLVHLTNRIILELGPLLKQGEGAFRFSLSQGNTRYITAIQVD